MFDEDTGGTEKPRSRRKDDQTKRNWSYLSSCSPLFHQCPQDGDGTDAQKHAYIPKRILLTCRSQYHVGAVLCLLTFMDDLWLPCMGQPSVVHLCCVWPFDPWPGVSGSWASEAAAAAWLQDASKQQGCFFLIHQSLSKGELWGSGASQGWKGPEGVPSPSSAVLLLLREAPGLKLFSCLCCPLVTEKETPRWLNVP